MWIFNHELLDEVAVMRSPPVSAKKASGHPTIKFQILPKCVITGLFAASRIDLEEGHKLWVSSQNTGSSSNDARRCVKRISAYHRRLIIYALSMCMTATSMKE